MSRKEKSCVLCFSLCVIGSVLLVHAEETRTAYNTISTPPIEAPATVREELLTGVCTFGDCPVVVAKNATTSQDIAKPSQEVAITSRETEPETVAPTVPEPVPLAPEDPEEPVWQGGRTVTCWVTAYCGCDSCSEGWGSMTATGVYAQPYHTIAVDPSVIPYGTQVEINGTVYTAEDCGGGVNGYSIDVYFAEHWQCETWGTGYYDVTIY